MLVTPPALMIIIRDKDGKEAHLEVRSFVEERLAKVSPGKPITLLLDDENKVTDIAIPHETH